MQPSETTTDGRRPDLDVVREQIEMAHDEVHRLCAGGRWTMQVPARPAKDSDLVISAALAHADWLLAELVSLRGKLEAATEPSEEVLDTVARVLDHSDYVDDWPEDERECYRRTGWASFEERRDAVNRLRARKIIAIALGGAR